MIRLKFRPKIASNPVRVQICDCRYHPPLHDTNGESLDLKNAMCGKKINHTWGNSIVSSDRPPPIELAPTVVMEIHTHSHYSLASFISHVELILT